MNALTNGALEVNDGVRTIRYRSFAEIREMLAFIRAERQRQAQPEENRMIAYAEFGRGLDR